MQEGGMKRLAAAVVLMLLACPAMAAVLPTATAGSGRAIGPSFDCASPDLSRADLELAQAYYALRQPPRQRQPRGAGDRPRRGPVLASAWAASLGSPDDLFKIVW